MTTDAFFTLDGAPVPFEPGDTVMDAALRAGRYIPHLCHHPDYTPHGSCRLCSVRIDGRIRAACVTPAEAGRAVENQTDALQRDRRRLLQMLFVEGNHFCPFCERSGNCQLQAAAYFVGMLDSHFAHAFPRRALDASHPDVLLDRDRCIACTLCVRASRETDGKNVFELSGRGAATRLEVNAASGLLKDTDLAATDRAVSVCPVGALIVKRVGYAVPIGLRRYDRHTIDEPDTD